MSITYLQRGCLLFALLIFSSVIQAKMYKWVDDDGQTHYSQHAPIGQQADVIKAPPPPAIDPNEAQKQVDDLVEQQSSTQEEIAERRAQEKTQQEEDKKLEEYCASAKHNLQQFQNNPGRRMVDDEGNVTRPTEEERQQKIREFQQGIDDFCK